MGRGRHDTLAPVDHPAGARELAGRGSVSLVANASSAKVVAVKDGEASTPNAGTACPEYAPTPLFAFDVQGARVTVWPAQPSGNARNRAGEGGEEDDSDSDDANRNTRDNHIGDNCGSDGTDCDNRIGDNGNCLNHIVYLHVYDGDGLDVLNECGNIDCPPFTLVAVKPACWNDDLAPWKCPGLFADDAPFAGRAQDQLHLLEEEIIPQVERECGKPNSPHICRTVAGYSLAGLFATWTALNSSTFSRIASASGSLWYPDFAHFVAESPLACPIDCAYFSLGSKEAKTPSRLLRNVATGTDEVVAAFRSKGVPTQFESNPGNHFKEPALRMARGITWAISQQATNR
ncbi:alpha/beta hydrolase-fold protein [Ellagibacter isourolithinifaciens]|uniref:alpha/beta hydrolase-fold protein n=1 Tax=Ellagibacter isourolithinifaciens TaxID=2137581 RepID=UPI003A94A597